jgi:peptidoglycan/LPS O-acetylase OafA/YrhL
MARHPSPCTQGYPPAIAETEQVVQAGEVRSARIESLRALAALGVLLAHVYGAVYGYVTPEDPGTFRDRLLLGGGFGVILFFALSGYLLYLPFARQTLGGGDRVDLANYARNRALRILPLYVVVVVALLVLRENGGTWSQWWRFLLFAQNFSTETVGTVNGVLWSLVVELHFYILLPLIAWLAARLGRNTRLGAAIVLLALAGGSVVVHYTKVKGAHEPGSQVWRYSILATFLYFVAGMLVALLRLAWEERRPGWLRGPLASAEAWLLAAVGIWLLVIGDYGLGPLAALASMLMVGAAVLPLQPGPLVRALDWRPLALIGVASYSVYMWHVPVLEWVVDAAGGIPGGFPGLLAITLALAIPGSFASYALIERPFLRLRRRWARSTAPQVGDARDGPRGGRTSPPAPSA